MLAIPSQSPGVHERYGLTEADTSGAAWAIDAGGAKHRGAAAVNLALAQLPGGWPGLSSVYRITPVRVLEDGVYELVARTRHWLGYLTRTPPEISP